MNGFRNEIVAGDCLEVLKGIPSGAFRLTLTSPPYEDARTYSVGFKLKGQGWVDWMAERVVEMCRCTAGLVLVNAAGKVRQFKYSPVMEWLVADLTRNHGIVCGPAPYVFHRVGIPGSGGPHYHRRDWEPVYAFALPEVLPPKWSDNTAMGHPPKYAPGGAMSNRMEDGRRKNARDKDEEKLPVGVYRAEDGTLRHLTRGTSGQATKGGKPVYPPPGTLDRAVTTIANPGNIIKCIVGGGVMGDSLCHENEAPFPESLVEFFIRSYCEEGAIVCDPFSGSGTVAKVAQRWGRAYFGIDVRESQVKLAKRRLNEHGVPLLAD